MNLNWISALFLAVMAGLSGVAKADAVVVQTACSWHESTGMGWWIKDAPTGCMQAASKGGYDEYDLKVRIELANPPDCRSVGGGQIGEKIMVSGNTDSRTFTVVRQCKVRMP